MHAAIINMAWLNMLLCVLADSLSLPESAIYWVHSCGNMQHSSIRLGPQPALHQHRT